MSYLDVQVCLSEMYRFVLLGSTCMSYCGIHVCFNGVHMYVLLRYILNVVVGAQYLGLLCNIVHAKSGEGLPPSVTSPLTVGSRFGRARTPRD